MLQEARPLPACMDRPVPARATPLRAEGAGAALTCALGEQETPPPPAPTPSPWALMALMARALAACWQVPVSSRRRPVGWTPGCHPPRPLMR